MSVFERITREIHSGMVLYTPVKRVKFKIDSIDAEKVVFSVGTKTLIPIPRRCFDGIPAFLSGKGWVKIGPAYNKAQSETLQEHLDFVGWGAGSVGSDQKKSHSSDANYVASVLEYLKIVEVNHSRPSKVRLK